MGSFSSRTRLCAREENHTRQAQTIQEDFGPGSSPGLTSCVAWTTASKKVGAPCPRAGLGARSRLAGCQPAPACRVRVGETKAGRARIARNAKVSVLTLRGAKSHRVTTSRKPGIPSRLRTIGTGFGIARALNPSGFALVPNRPIAPVHVGARRGPSPGPRSELRPRRARRRARARSRAAARSRWGPARRSGPAGGPGNRAGSREAAGGPGIAREGPASAPAAAGASAPWPSATRHGSAQEARGPGGGREVGGAASRGVAGPGSREAGCWGPAGRGQPALLA